MRSVKTIQSENYLGEEEDGIGRDDKWGLNRRAIMTIQTEIGLFFGAESTYLAKHPILVLEF